MNIKTLLITAISIGLLGAACSAETAAPAPEADESTHEQSSAAPFETPVTIIDASTSDGGQTTLEELIDGDRPVVLWSFAAWCVNCRADAPDIEAFAAANPEVQVIGVGALDSADASVEFIQDTGVATSEVVWAGEGPELWQQLGFSGRTENIVFSPDLSEQIGPNFGFDAEEVTERIASLG